MTHTQLKRMVKRAPRGTKAAIARNSGCTAQEVAHAFGAYPMVRVGKEKRERIYAAAERMLVA